MQEGETTGEKCDGNGGSPWEFRSLYFFFPTGNMKTTRGFKKKRLFSAWVEEALALDLGYTEQVRKEGGNV